MACTNNWQNVIENKARNIRGFGLFEMIIDSSQKKLENQITKCLELWKKRSEKVVQTYFLLMTLTKTANLQSTLDGKSLNLTL